MRIFPAIDLYEGKAVRLSKGDFNRMTVYSDNPVSLAREFSSKGAEYLHIVDLEGAKSGETPNAATIEAIAQSCGLKIEIGGGIRNGAVVKRYLDIGVSRVILGTAAIENFGFLEDMIGRYGDKIAVGVDLKGENVAIKGWLEDSEVNCYVFFERLEKIGVDTVICTDISRDGMLSGANIGLYQELALKYKINFIASGGVTSIEDIKRLSALGLYGAILGRALYTGNIDLEEALAAAKEEV